MQTKEILVAMMNELGKLVLRSEGKSDSTTNNIPTLAEGGLKLLDWMPDAFEDADSIRQVLQSKDQLTLLLGQLIPENGRIKEPCLCPLTLSAREKKNASGFMPHIFKGEQEISTISGDKLSVHPKYYARLLHELRRDIKILGTPLDLSTWLYLLHRYTHWMPTSSYLQDISLSYYCQWKMALAACLSRNEIEQLLQYNCNEEHREKGQIALYSVKILGTTQFLAHHPLQHNFTAWQGAVGYWQLLMILLRDEFLKAIDLPLCNCLWEDSEGFTLLVRPSHANILAEMQLHLEKFLAMFYQGAIHIATSFVSTHIEALLNKEFFQISRLLSEQLCKQEQQGFAKLCTGNSQIYHNLFDVYPQNHYTRLFQIFQDFGNQWRSIRWIAIEPCSTLSSASQNHNGNPSPSQLVPSIELDFPAFFQKKITLVTEDIPIDHNYSSLYRINHTDFITRNGKGFIFTNAIPWLEPQKNSSHRVVLHIRADIHKATATDCALLQCIQRHGDIAMFFYNNFRSLLHTKIYRHATYYAALHRQTFILVCDAEIGLTALSEIHNRLCRTTKPHFHLTGHLQVLNEHYPAIEFLLYNRPHAIHGKLILNQEVVAWSFLDSIIRAQSRLAGVNIHHNRHTLFELWKMVLQVPRNEQWNALIDYHLQRLGIQDVLERHIIESERGKLYLYQSLFWNFLVPEAPKIIK